MSGLSRSVSFLVVVVSLSVRRALSLSYLVMFTSTKDDHPTYTTPDSSGSSSHHAPAGGTSSKLTHDDPQSRPKGAPVSASGDADDISAVPSTNVKAWLAEDGHSKLLASRTLVLETAVACGCIPQDRATAKLLVEHAISIIIDSVDPMTAAAEISSSFNVPHTLGLALIDFLTTGTPPAGAVVYSLREALSVASAGGITASPSPASGGGADVVAAIESGFQQVKHFSRLPSEHMSELKIREARDSLASYEPSFWFSLASKEWGALSVQVADYSRAMQRMPLHSDVSRTKMLPTVADLRKIIVSAIANKAMWPQCRFILFGHLGDLYGSHTGPLILQGVAPGAARTSGEEFIGVCLTEAVSTITLLFAQTTEAMRSATPDAIARALLVSIDNLLAPDSKSLIDQEWFSMGLAKGESAHDFFLRLRSAAARSNRQYAELVERFTVALQIVARDPGTPQAVALGVGNVSGHLPRVISASFDASALDISLKAEPIFTALLWRKTAQELKPLLPAGERPPLGGIPGNAGRHGHDLGTLATNPNKKFWDLKVFYDAFLQATGKPLGDGIIPPSRARGRCNTCSFFGIEIVAYSDDLRESMRSDRSRRFDHNEWGCPNIEILCNKLAADHVDIEKDKILRLIDNPREAALAHGAV